jgi:WD40 repeat protein
MAFFKDQGLLHFQWHDLLSDYVTAIAWSPNGSNLAVCSACGEVVLYDLVQEETIPLQTETGQSLDTLSFSADGRFLATAGQSGTVTIWPLASAADPIEIAHERAWIDCLQWNPRFPDLAFSTGRNAQIWDASTGEITATLNFETSSVLDLAWHPEGTFLALGGNQRVKTWQRQDWQAEPQVREIGGASGAIAWSLEGRYLASGNNDRTLLVWEMGNPHPWQMQGFAGKVRQLAWSVPVANRGKLASVGCLASISAEGIVVWTKDPDPAIGWAARMLNLHSDKVMAIAFHPQSLLLASAAADGWVCLWKKARQVAQVLQGAPQGFSCLAWHPQGTALAAGGQQGEVVMWRTLNRGKGFG